MTNREPDVTGKELAGGIVVMGLLLYAIVIVVSFCLDFENQKLVADKETQRKYLEAQAELNPNNLTQDQLFIEQCQRTNSRFACVELLQQKQAIEEQKRTERTDFWLNFLIHR